MPINAYLYAFQNDSIFSNALQGKFTSPFCTCLPNSFIIAVSKQTQLPVQSQRFPHFLTHSPRFHPLRVAMSLNLLPKTHQDFGQKDYWNSFFEKRAGKAFEWCVAFLAFLALVLTHCHPHPPGTASTPNYAASYTNTSKPPTTS